MFRRNSRFQRKLRLIPVDSHKNIAQFQGGVAHGGNISTIPLAVGVDTPLLANQTDVAAGATIHSIEVHVRIINVGNAVANLQQIAIYKSPENEFQFTAADLNSLGTVARKRWCLHFDHLNIDKPGGAVMEWHLKIKIPRSFKTMRNSDRFYLAIANNDGLQDTSFCGFAIYKWYI